MMIEFINRLVELLGNAIVWMVALTFLSIAIFGGKINIEIDGLTKLIQYFKGG